MKEEPQGLLKLPTANEIIKLALSKPQTLKISQTCSISIMQEECIYKIWTTPKGCIHVSDVTKRLVPTIPMSLVYSLGKGVVSKLGFVEAFLDKCTKSMLVSTVSVSSISIYPKLSISNASLSINVSLAPPAGFAFTFSGLLNIGSLPLQVSVSKDRDSWWIHGTTQLRMSLGSLMNNLVSGAMFSTSEKTNVLRALKLDALNSITLSKIKVVLENATEGLGAQVSFNLNVPSLGSSTIHMYINRYRDAPASTVVAMDIGSTSLAVALRKMTSVNIAGVPIIGDMQLDAMTIAYATKNVTEPIVPYDVPALLDIGVMERGIHFFFGVRFEPNGPPLKFHVRRFNRTINFEVLGDSEESISSLLNKVVKDVKIPLPPGFNLGNFLSAPLSVIQYDPDSKVLNIPAVSGKNIVLIPKLLKLENTTVDFSLAVGNGQTSRLGASVQATWDLGKYDIRFTVSKPAGESIYIGEARPDFEIPIGKYLTKFGKALLPKGPLRSGFGKLGLSSFLIKNPEIALYFAGGYAVKTTGTAAIGSFDGCDVQVLTGTVSNSAVMALGVVLKKAPLTDITYKITDGKINLKRLPGSAILDNSDLGLVISSQVIPMTEPYMRFSVDLLKDIEVFDGLSLSGAIKIPPACKSDQFCQVLQNFFGKNFQIVLNGRIAATSIKLQATIPREIHIFKGATISGLGFEVEAGLTRNAIGLLCTLQIPNPALTFSGSFGMSQAGVYLQMSMKGWWNKAFGVPFLHIGNLHFRVAIPPTPVIITQLEIGGMAKIGFLNKAKAVPIEAAMYLGMDTTSPMENYFFGNVSRLTVPAILAAFAYRPSLPKALSEIGFPRGVYVSYALQTKVLPNGISIPRGLYFKGLLKILKFELQSDVSVDLNGIFINTTATGFNMGNGLISVTDASGKGGPKLFVDVGWNPPRATLKISGAVSILRIRRSIDILVDAKGMHFKLTGSFLGVFQSYLEVSSNYQSMDKLDFRVKGGFRQDLFTQLRTRVLNSLDSQRKRADAAISGAQAKVLGARRNFENAQRKLREVSASVESKKRVFIDASNKMNAAQSKVNGAKRHWDNAVRGLRSAESKVNGAKRHFDNAVNKLRSAERKCPRACRRSEYKEHVSISTTLELET